MALVTYAGGIGQMSGKLGGIIYARNSGGNYARVHRVPVNPNTALQQAVRSSLAELTVAWSSTLSAANRTAWNLYASSVTVLNRLGEAINISGFNHFIRSNTEFLNRLDAITVAGPVIFEIPEQDPTLAITATEAGQTISISFNNALDWANESGGVMFIYQGSPQNGQRNFFGGPWRYIGRILGDDAVPPASPNVMPVDFAIAEGQRQWIKVRIRRLDGRLSEPFRAEIEVGA